MSSLQRYLAQKPQQPQHQQDKQPKNTNFLQDAPPVSHVRQVSFSSLSSFDSRIMSQNSVSAAPVDAVNQSTEISTEDFPRSSLKEVVASLSRVTKTTTAAEEVQPMLSLKDRHKSTSARERKRLIEERYLKRISLSCPDLNQPKNQDMKDVNTISDSSMSEPQQQQTVAISSSIQGTSIQQKSLPLKQPSSLQRALAKENVSSDTSLSSFSYKRKTNRIPVSKLTDLPSSTKSVEKPLSSLQIALQTKNKTNFNPHRPVVVTNDVLLVSQSPPPSFSGASKKKKKKKDKKQRKQQRMYQQMQQEVQQQVMFQQQQMYYQMPPPAMVYNDGSFPPNFYSHQHPPSVYPPNQTSYNPSLEELAMNYQHHNLNCNDNMWPAGPSPLPMARQGSISDANSQHFSNCGTSTVANSRERNH